MGITNMVIRGKSRDIRGNKIADVLVPGDLNEIGTIAMAIPACYIALPRP